MGLSGALMSVPCKYTSANVEPDSLSTRTKSDLCSDSVSNFPNTEHIELPESQVTRINLPELFQASNKLRKFCKLDSIAPSSREFMFLLNVFAEGLEPTIDEWAKSGWPYQRPLQALREAMSERGKNCTTQGQSEGS
jgi:hypothetical protein